MSSQRQCNCGHHHGLRSGKDVKATSRTPPTFYLPWRLGNSSYCMFTGTKMPPAPLRSADAQHKLKGTTSAGLTSAVTVSRGASYLTIQTLITSIAQALSFAILARIITQSEVGILAVLSLITALTQALNGAAFQQASSRFIGELGSDSREVASAVFYQSMRVTLLFQSQYQLSSLWLHQC